MYSLRSKCAFAENNYDSYVFWSMYGDGGRGRENGRFCGEARNSNVDLVKKLSFYAPDGRPLLKHLDVYFCPLWDTMAAPCLGRGRDAGSTVCMVCWPCQASPGFSGTVSCPCQASPGFSGTVSWPCQASQGFSGTVSGPCQASPGFSGTVS